MGLEEAGGRVWLVVWMEGGEVEVVVVVLVVVGGYSAVRVHKKKMVKHVCSCHGTQCFFQQQE